MIQCWRLDDAQQTLVLAADNDQLAEIIYWGARLPDQENLQTLYQASIAGITGGMLDKLPVITVCPQTADTFPGHPGLILRSVDGVPLYPQFCLDKVEFDNRHVKLDYIDPALSIRYQVSIEIDSETGLISAQSSLLANDPVRLEWLAAPVIPIPGTDSELIDFSGRWCGEFQPVKANWQAGTRSQSNVTGRTGHEHFPGAYSLAKGTTNTHGEARAMHYAWSGGHGMIAEQLADGRRQIQFGNTSGSEQKPVTTFKTATLFLAWSNRGLNGCAEKFQRHLRQQIIPRTNPELPRPVHFNCWEAIYFTHDQDELAEIARRAADLGAERFVLDDGWFRARGDDRSSLGDWHVDTNKYPEGLHPLIKTVHQCGMEFGLWFEPEMINLESELARNHPDWILGPVNQTEGRHQRVLDLSRANVTDYLFDRIDTLLIEYPITYIKWDHNRVLPYPDASQTRALYALLDRLRSAHPEVEFESCASGGGRIDFGILERCSRVWLSDSNDALERMRIQHDAALFLPGIVTGSHVGPRKCHSSGRVLNIHLRAWVAASRHFGFELDPRELDDDEKRAVKHVCDWWKNNRQWLSQASILRLDSADDAVIAEQQNSTDQRRFVVFACKHHTSNQISPLPLQLTDLNADAMYRIELVNRDEIVHLSRGNSTLKSQAIKVSGTWLMNSGIQLPWQFPQSIWVVEGTRL